MHNIGIETSTWHNIILNTLRKSDSYWWTTACISVRYRAEMYKLIIIIFFFSK